MSICQLPHFSQRFKAMFNVNDPGKGGSFYIQSKIYRSKEVLEQEVLGITPDLPQDYAATNPADQEHSQEAKKPDKP